MTDRIREMLLVAIDAARHGVPPPPPLIQAVSDGSRQLTLDDLQFDSLGWMEFCISIELQSGQELTPFVVEGMRCVFQIEDWIRERMGP
jgi:hypothetical protein